jgi:glucokinase
MSARYLGLDLGGTNIKFVVVEADGGEPPRMVASGRTPTKAEGGPDAVVERLLSIGRGAIGERGPMAAVGLGVPGLFDPGSGVVRLFPNLLGPWAGVPLRDRLEAGLTTRVAVVNDARAFALAEATMGAGRGSATVVCVTLGTGVGGGIVIDGRLHTGAWGAAGEIGHQTVVPDGPPCGCGNRGCVEALAQAGALARLAGRSTPDEVFAGVRDGDAQCRRAVDTVAGYLGIAIANCVTVLGADRVVVGGGIAAAGELLLGPIRGVVRQRATLVPADEISVVPAALGGIAGAVGAAMAARDSLRAQPADLAR